MKIAIDARIMYTSTGRYVERLLHHLQQIDKKTQYIVLLDEKDMEKWQPISPNFSKVACSAPPYTLREQLQFARQLYQLGVDLVHFTMPQHPLLYFRSHVVTVHDLTLMDFVNKRLENPVKDLYKYSVKPAVFKVFMRLSSRKVHRFIVPTQTVKHAMMHRLGTSSEKIAVTHEAADPIDAKPEPLAKVVDKRFVFYVGNATPHKNLERLIEAFERVNDPELYLVLAGKPDYFYQKLQQLVVGKNLSRVIFTGWISDAQLAWLYKNTQLYIFPSLAEGFGLPGLEAMEAGAPVASSSIPTLKEVYGEAAEYFDPTDTADMAATITNLLTDKKRRQELVQRGKQQVKKYSWHKMAQQTLNVYRSILNQ